MVKTFFIDISVVLTAVIIHAEMLYLLTLLLYKLKKSPRFKILVAVLGVILSNVIGIWFFASVYYILINYFDYGGFYGQFSGDFLDCVYFSFVSYTSLGMGDIYPLGSVRFLTGLEALTGLILITWSASFLYIEMQESWHGIRAFLRSKNQK